MQTVSKRTNTASSAEKTHASQGNEVKEKRHGKNVERVKARPLYRQQSDSGCCRSVATRKRKRGSVKGVLQGRKARDEEGRMADKEGARIHSPP